MKDKMQLIKQEIERLYKHYLDAQEFDSGYNMALDNILKFIDSLPEEPASEDLEEAANQHSKQVFHGFLIEDNIIAFKAGAEWQKERRNKQFGFLNLKDCKDAYNEWKSTQDEPSAALAWVRACEWQKQKAFQDFLEKAEEFFNEELFTRFNGAEYRVASNKCMNLQQFIEQFKNYIQDESKK